MKDFSAKKELKNFILYLLVGGGATLVEWAFFWLLSTPLGIYHMVSTTVAYIISTFANWLFGRLLVFKKTDKGIVREIADVYAASIIGLLLNLLIMWLAVDILSFNKMISKIIATVLVFAWNYLIRKLVIYKEKH